MIQLTSLLLGVALAITQFLIGPLQPGPWWRRPDDLILVLLALTILPRGLLIGLLMGFITNHIGQSPLFVRLICLVSVGPVLFTVLGGFLYRPHATTTNLCLGMFMGLSLGLAQAIVLPFLTTKVKLKFDNELPVWKEKYL